MVELGSDFSVKSVIKPSSTQKVVDQVRIFQAMLGFLISADRALHRLLFARSYIKTSVLFFKRGFDRKSPHMLPITHLAT